MRKPIPLPTSPLKGKGHFLSAPERERAMALLLAEVARSNVTRAALRIDYDRATVSLVARGIYNASPDQVLLAVLAALDRIACPYLGAEVEASYCQETNTGPTPTWDPSALAQRRMCQTCPNKPVGRDSSRQPNQGEAK